MLDKKVADLLVEQVNKEFYSAYLYLDFANYYEEAGLSGFAHWYEVQAQEERDHAMTMRRYLIDNGVPVTFAAIDAPGKVYADASAPLGRGAQARVLRHLAHLRHLCGCGRGQRLPHHAVFRLVRQGAG